jgi:S-DNA-T family DNA segregation ATPase FtsK/SpoIIIE
MKKKRSAKSTSDKKRTIPNQKPRKDLTEIQGLFVLSAAIALILSLLSFSYGPEGKNWIGLLGFTTGKILHATFGLGSYFICLYMAWIGWRLLFSKPISHPWIKGLYLFVFVASLCIILSLIEDRLPSVATVLGNTFYTNLWQRRLHYHLGGALFYYLYHDLPLFNLRSILNTTGVAILFSCTSLASLLFFAKKTPAQMLAAVINFLQNMKAKFSMPPQEEGEESDQPNVELTPEEDNQMRFVKLRIPEGSQPAQPASSSKTTAPGNSQEMLGIQPETKLTVRPSISQKTMSENGRPPILSSHFKKERKEPPSDLPQPTTLPAPITPTEANKPASPPANKKRQNALAAQKVYNGDFTHFTTPSASLLTSGKKQDQSSLKQDLRRQAEVLEETLLSFGIEAKVGQINCGPTITSFEVHPAIGVKVQKIKTLENDIALNMEAKSIRIIAPIPGKAAVGIEVPNAQPQEVAFKDMLAAYQQGSRKFHIPILLGKAVTGDYVMSDLTKMPHCIIAGATGSGKSVCINTIVMSILLNAKPDEIKLIMVDPKKVELTAYTKLPHMLAPVITEPQGACAALNWLVKEMENRYEILKQLGVRNIDAFNTRTINAELEASLDREIPARMPYIVVIIDELADLMMVASNDIETPIARIAQMARAVGIHLILATQRPSREVITGLIKANFPTRISFKVASRINSQIILDESGAEALLGNGDLLFLPPGTSVLVRAQGAFIRDEDINAVVKHICDQAPPNYVIASFDALGNDNSPSSSNSAKAPSDSLYDQAVNVVLTSKNASTTFLQRKLKIGYARAASLIDELETAGIIGKADGSKAREIIMQPNKTEADNQD